MVTAVIGNESVIKQQPLLIPRLIFDDVHAVFYLGKLVGDARTGDNTARHVIAYWRRVFSRADCVDSITLCAGDAGGPVLPVVESDGGDEPGGRGDPLVCPCCTGGAKRRFTA